MPELILIGTRNLILIDTHYLPAERKPHAHQPNRCVMKLRESRLIRAACWTVTGWAALFGVTFVVMGDTVTSGQWRYLMGVPGGTWFWLAVFTGSAAVAAVGLARHHHAAVGAGLFVIGSGCLLITVFYLLAPLIDPGLFTLGWFPWALCAATAYMCSVANWRAVSWF